MSDPWPALPLDEWEPTRRTVHLWSQVVGKVALALAPTEPEWNHVALEVTPRGIATRPLPYAPSGNRGHHPTGRLVVEFDFIDEALRVVSSTGESSSFVLHDGLSVAEFYGRALDAIGELGVVVTINPKAQEMPDPPMLDELHGVRSFDADAVRRFHQALVSVGNALAVWRAAFRGRATPVNFWWGTFDLAVARFSGRALDPPPGVNVILRMGMDAEDFAVGFWAGDERYPKAALYAYAYPEPDGIEVADVLPSAASWNAELGEFVLDWDAVRSSDDPAAAIVEFAESTYRAGATLAGWDVDALSYP